MAASCPADRWLCFPRRLADRVFGTSPEPRSGMIPSPGQLERHFCSTARALRGALGTVGFRKQRRLLDRLCALLIYESCDLNGVLCRRLSGREQKSKEPGKQDFHPVRFNLDRTILNRLTCASDRGRLVRTGNLRPLPCIFAVRGASLDIDR